MTTIRDFVEITTVHQGELFFWWTQEQLHNVDYHIQVWDSLDAKVSELEKKYGVQDDTELRCQFEGRRLLGDDREKVEAAIHELASHLMQFDGIRAL
jgi:hypothetical protein